MKSSEPNQRSPEEQAFLDAYDPSEFDRPSVAIDVALVCVHQGQLAVLLVQREQWPDKGKWGLPGGFVGISESLDETARNVLRAKAGLEDVYIEQLYTFGAPGRDPRMRILSVAYYALVDHARLANVEGEGRALVPLEVPWSGEVGHALEVPGFNLALDHGAILGAVVKRMRGKLDYAALGFQLLPDAFTLRDLQSVHEAVLGKQLNKDSFRRRLLASGWIEPTGEREQDVLHRPAELYRIKDPSAI